MRIALVTETFYPAVRAATDAGGRSTTTTVRQVADRLVDLGHDVAVVAPGPGLASWRGAPVARIDGPDTGARVRAALAGFGPDLVHVTSPGRVGRKALKHAARLGFPTLLVEQSHVPQAAVEPWLRKARSRADHALVTTRWMHTLLATEGIEPPPVWAPGVDTAAFAPHLRDAYLHGTWSRARSRGGPRVVVGHAGSLRNRHGVRRVVEVDQVPGTRTVVIGDGPQRRWLRERLPDGVFPGTLGGADLSTALASLDVLVHPGEHETCCHVLREAAASGVPVVAPASGGALDAVRHEKTGLLYDTDDPRALRRAVARLVGDHRLREELGAAARERALRRSWKDAVDELVDVHYRDTLRRATHAGTAPDRRLTAS
jgi:phosphatidylinositol alpha 1,6-mannosyltransferase